MVKLSTYVWCAECIVNVKMATPVVEHSASKSIAAKKLTEEVATKRCAKF